MSFVYLSVDAAAIDSNKTLPETWDQMEILCYSKQTKTHDWAETGGFPHHCRYLMYFIGHYIQLFREGDS